MNTLQDRICELEGANAALQNKIAGMTKIVYKYSDPKASVLRARWWNADAGPHLDPAQWSGAVDVTGHPLPAAAPTQTNNAVSLTNSINELNSGPGGAMRYGVLDGFIKLPDDARRIREVNSNTGELGGVFLAHQSNGILIERPGSNHGTGNSANTNGGDRGVMDPNPITGGYWGLFAPMSDFSAYQGWDLEFSRSTTLDQWEDVTEMRHPDDPPEVVSQRIPACDPVPEGWSEIRPADVAPRVWLG